MLPLPRGLLRALARRLQLGAQPLAALRAPRQGVQLPAALDRVALENAQLGAQARLLLAPPLRIGACRRRVCALRGELRLRGGAPARGEVGLGARVLLGSRHLLEPPPQRAPVLEA